jgi:hypothetical protein
MFRDDKMIEFCEKSGFMVAHDIEGGVFLHFLPLIEVQLEFFSFGIRTPPFTFDLFPFYFTLFEFSQIMQMGE